jgi:hypothetical protein
MKYEVNSRTNRVNEASLQQTYEEILKEIQQMKLSPRDEKKLIAMLQKYRSAWNSYINRIKPRESRTAS